MPSTTTDWGQGNQVHSPIGQFQPAATKTVRVTNVVDNGVTVAEAVLVSTELPQFDIWRDTHAMMQRLYDHLRFEALLNPEILGFDREPFFAESIVVMQETQTNDIQAIQQYLGRPEVGAWMAIGHGGADQLLAGIDGFISYPMDARDVAFYMGNEVIGNMEASPKYSKRHMYDFLSGCGTTGGYWPAVLGTPPSVDQESNNNMDKSCFFGWSGIALIGPTMDNFWEVFHYIWAEQDPDTEQYDFPIAAAFAAGFQQYPVVRDWGPVQYGYRLLDYQASDHPHN